LISTTPANRRNVKKWTLFDPDLLQIRIQTSKKLIAKAGSDSSGEIQVLAFVKTDKQRAEIFPAAFRMGISADHEFLLKMQLELDPGASPFPGFVPGTGAFMLSCLRNNSIGLTRFDTTPNKKEVIDQVEEYFGRRTERESPG
jgi:hypothetical protein